MDAEEIRVSWDNEQMSYDDIRNGDDHLISLDCFCNLNKAGFSEFLLDFAHLLEDIKYDGMDGDLNRRCLNTIEKVIN